MPEVRVVSTIREARFSCQRCGSCCHHRRPEGFPDLIPMERLKEFWVKTNLIYLTPAEVEAISRHTGKKPEDFVDTLYPYDGKTVKVLDRGSKVVLDLPVMKSQETSLCVFYGEGGCGIYPLRPRACRLFPFRVDEETGPCGDIALKLGYNPNCPGLGKGKAVNQRYLEQMVVEQFQERSQAIYPQLMEAISRGDIARDARIFRSYPGRRLP